MISWKELRKRLNISEEDELAIDEEKKMIEDRCRNFSEVKKELLQDPEVKKEYDRLGPKYEKLFYKKSNVEHLLRGIKALDEGKGKEHELIEVDA